MTAPEKPSLDGLEEKWAARWEADGTYRFDRSKPREEVYSIDTPPPTVSGSLHVGHVFSYTHTDAIARFQRMRGPRGLLPDGLGRQRPPHRAPGAELLRRALRPVAAVRPRLRAAREAAASRRSPISRGGTSSSCATGSWSRTSRSSRSCGARSGLSVDWSTDLHDHRRARRSVRRSVRSCAMLARGRGVPGGGAHAVGRRLPHCGRAGRARGPRGSRRVPRGPLPLPSTAAATS